VAGYGTSFTFVMHATYYDYKITYISWCASRTTQPAVVAANPRKKK